MSAAPASTAPAASPASVVNSLGAPSAGEQPLSGWNSNASIWLQESSATKGGFDFPAVAADTNVGTFDCIVVGGGIVGVTSAWLLKKAGKKVALVEARRIGAGTTGFSTAKLTSQQQLIYTRLISKYDENTARLYGEMQETAITQVETLVNELKLACDFRRTPHATWTCDDSKVKDVEKEYEDAIKLGLPAELLHAKDIEVPASIGVKRAIRFKNQAEFNAYKFCVELAKHVNGGGCMVFENSMVNAVGDMGTPHKVTCTNGGYMDAHHVILATHLPIMDRSHHFAFVPPSKSHVVAVKLGKGDGTQAKVGAGQLRAMYINADKEKRSIRTTQDGSVLIVSGESFETGDETDVEHRYQALEKWAKEHFVVESCITRWSSMDYFSSTILPYIGLLYRGSSTIFTATGFSKWGLTNGVASGMIFRDAITGVSNPWADMVDARRWDIHAVPGAVMEMWHTTKHMVADKVKARFAPDISTLKPGDGGIVKANGETVGAYLDKNGQYHLVTPVCTHLGCNVLFNHTDRTWDCPCHGSQFAIDGSVIHGPACKSLCKRDDLLKDIEDLKK